MVNSMSKTISFIVVLSVLSPYFIFGQSQDLKTILQRGGALNREKNAEENRNKLLEIAREEYPYIYDAENNRTIIPVDENGMLTVLGSSTGYYLSIEGFFVALALPQIINLAGKEGISVLQAAKIILPNATVSGIIVRVPYNLYKIIQRNLYRGELLDEGGNLIKRIRVGKLTPVSTQGVKMSGGFVSTFFRWFNPAATIYQTGQESIGLYEAIKTDSAFGIKLSLEKNYQQKLRNLDRKIIALKDCLARPNENCPDSYYNNLDEEDRVKTLKLDIETYEKAKGLILKQLRSL